MWQEEGDYPCSLSGEEREARAHDLQNYPALSRRQEGRFRGGR